MDPGDMWAEVRLVEAEGSASTEGGETPEGRQGAAYATDEGTGAVYVFGGRGGRRNGAAGGDCKRRLLNDLWMMDAGGRWTCLWDGDDVVAADVGPDVDVRTYGRQGAPVVRHNAGMVLVPHDRVLVLVAGSTHFAYLGDVWLFSLDDATWTEVLPAGPPLAPRHGHALVRSRNSVVVVGGHCGLQRKPKTLTYFGDVCVLDLVSWSWTPMTARMAFPRSWMGAAEPCPDSGLILLAGGYSYDVARHAEVYVDTIEAYSLADDAFLPAAPDLVLPSPRNRVCLAALAGTVVVHGGNTLVPGRGDVFHADLVVIDASAPDPLAWRVVPTIPPLPPLPPRGHGIAIARPVDADADTDGASESALRRPAVARTVAALRLIVWGGERARVRLTDTLTLDVVVTTATSHT